MHLRFFFFFPSPTRVLLLIQWLVTSSCNAFSTADFIYTAIDCKGLQGIYIDNAFILNPIYAVFHEQLRKQMKEFNFHSNVKHNWCFPKPSLLTHSKRASACLASREHCLILLGSAGWKALQVWKFSKD